MVVYTKDDILKMLNDGQNADTIMQDFTNAMNAALRQQEEEKKAKREAELKVKAIEAEADKVIAANRAFVKTYFPAAMKYIPATGADFVRTLKEALATEDDVKTAFDALMNDWEKLRQDKDTSNSTKKVEKTCADPLLELLSKLPFDIKVVKDF